MRNIDDLLKQQEAKAPKAVLTAEEINHAAYLADLERFRDMTPDADRMQWAKPIGPLWKN